MNAQAAAKTLAALALLSLGFALDASAVVGKTLPRADAKFLQKAAADGMAEVELGKLAQRKAMREEVKEFASREVDDHGKANDEIKALAATYAVDLPAGLDRRHQKLMERLDKLVGGDFDREYMKRMVSDHKKDVREYRHEAKPAAKPEDDNDVKPFAAKTLPILQEHLVAAQKTHDITLAAKRTGDREVGSTKK